MEKKTSIYISFVSKVVFGIALGLALNIAWFIFTGVVFGWGDSAPDWYFKIQSLVFYGLFISAVLAVFVGSHLLDKKDRKKKKWITI